MTLKSYGTFHKLTSFPRTMKDLNLVRLTTMPIIQDMEFSAYSDTQYRKRQQAIGQLSRQHKMEQNINQVQYTAEDHQLWRRIINKLQRQHEKAMVEPYLTNMDFLKRNLNFHHRIPRMNDLSNYLKERTGFQLKPVPGIIPARQFLNCLAFKVFCSSQFIRHPLTENCAPEPDLVHEYIGRIPMIADEFVAVFFLL